MIKIEIFKNRDGKISGYEVTGHSGTAARGEDIVMKSDGSQIRSYCYSLDCASAMLKVLTEKDITGSGATSNDWQTTNIEWTNNDGTIKNQVLYSLYGYIRVDQRNNIVVVDNGSANLFNINTGDAAANFNRLPAVRYMLPYPEEAIARSNGVYKNYYGY